jgi:O-antigen ligase
LSSLLRPSPGADTIVDTHDETGPAQGRLLVRYGWLLGYLLAGYLLFDKAFAYIHLPGTPLYVGEMVLVVGGVGVLAATGYLRAAVSEPVLALLAALFLWGLIRFLPGLRAYGIDAVRDFALVYYSLFAFFTAAALARSPGILERLIGRLGRLLPWLLIWLALDLLLEPLAVNAPNVPGTSVRILTHKPGNAAIAALLALGFLWLFPRGRSARSRAVWSIVALVVIALSATQNRGGLLGATAGMAIGLAFVPDRLRLIVRALLVVALGLGIATQLSLAGPTTPQGRSFSASQLLANVASIWGANDEGNLSGTVQGRDVIWSRILHKQESDKLVIRGSGFGPNLQTQVGVYDAGTDATRSPHNSHLDILARTGLVGLLLWVAVWFAWYWHMVAGCRRLARRGLGARRQVAVLCLMVTTAILVSSFFDPQLEGAQVAALLWTVFGAGLAVTSFRGWLGDRTDLHIAAAGPGPTPPRSRTGPGRREP